MVRLGKRDWIVRGALAVALVALIMSLLSLMSPWVLAGLILVTQPSPKQERALFLIDKVSGSRGKAGQATVASFRTWRISPAVPPRPLTPAL